ncbi:MAG: signal peptidase I [Clostridia bacterium]|nr:signal peptidase I [Clostridia bacterium]
MKKLLNKNINVLDNRKFNTIVNIVSTVILVISIVICVNVVLSANADIGVPNFGNYSFLTVKSSSMNPTFYEGDLIVVRRYKPETKHKYEVGDVISFVAKSNTGENFINTHRIVEVIEGANGRSYVTKGDHPKATVDKSHVDYRNVLGVFTGVHVSKLGKFLEYTKTPNGVILLIVLPAALIVIWQLIGYFRSFEKRKAAPAAANSSAATSPQQYYPPAAESEKEAIIQEYLREQRAEEARKQQIIEEYLAKQKELEEQQKAKAEEEKIKAIIAEFLAQQKAAEDAGKKSDETSDGETDN